MVEEKERQQQVRQQPVSDITIIPHIKTTQEPRNFTKKGPVKQK